MLEICHSLPALTVPEMNLVAEAIYSRARAGADFETLQKEAFDAANLKEEPSVKLEKLSSFESVKSDVQLALQKQRMDTWLKDIEGSTQTKLNEQYFGPAAAKLGQ